MSPNTGIGWKRIIIEIKNTGPTKTSHDKSIKRLTGSTTKPLLMVILLYGKVVKYSSSCTIGVFNSDLYNWN